MPIATRTFRVFVSSTFEDLKAERDALQHDVFPKLRTLCEQHGARFQAIDLRWGVRDEAALDQQTMAICLREIQRCKATGVRPNFIALLGDRYGWRPLPVTIPAAEFEALRAYLPARDSEVALQWYRLDENAVPPEYCLQPRTGEFVEPSTWNLVEESLLRALTTAARAAGLSEKELIKYEASATHQEILAGLGETEEDRQHVFGFVRRPTRNTDPRLDPLKSHLRVHEFYAGDIKGFCELVLTQLRQAIEAEVKRFKDRPALDLEIEAHDLFAEERCRVFVGRESALDMIADYIRGPERRPLVLHGESGSGKSAVMAKASQQYKGPGRVIRRFIGASPESASGHALLTSLCRQIAPGETPVDYAQLENAFREQLSVATAERPLVLFIDALDQLAASDPARDVTWLPSELLPHVKVIVSTTDDASRLPAGLLVRLERVTQSEGGEALDKLLREARRTLQPWQRNTVMAHFERCGLPLYLKLAAEESRLWKSYTSQHACPLGEGVAGVIDTLFDRLASNANHGPTLVERSLGYLAAARYGLTEGEVLDVLTADDAVWKDFDQRKHHEVSERRLPVVVWSRLSLDLGPYLTEHVAPGGTVIAFFHRQLSVRVTDRYLGREEHRLRHDALARYFAGQRNWLDDAYALSSGRKAPKKVPNRRKLFELPYHQLAADLVDDLGATLTDLEFVRAKCESQMVFDLVADFDAASEKDLGLPSGSILRGEQFSALHHLIRSEASAISHYPLLCLTQLLNGAAYSPSLTSHRLRDRLWSECRQQPAIYLVLEQFLSARRSTGSTLAHLHEHSAPITALCSLSHRKAFLAAYSDGEIHLCDERTGQVRQQWSLEAILPDTILTAPGSCRRLRDRVLLGLESGDVVCLNPDSGQFLRQSPKAVVGAIVDLDVLPEKGLFAFTATDNSASVWSIADPSAPVKLAHSTDPVPCCRFDPQADQLVLGVVNGEIRFWPLSDPEPSTVARAPGRISRLELDSDRYRALLAVDDTLYELSLSDRALRVVLKVRHPILSISLAVPPWVLLGTAAKELLLVSTDDGAIVETIQLSDPVRCFEIGSDGRSVLVGSGNDVFSLKSQEHPREMQSSAITTSVAKATAGDYSSAKLLSVFSAPHSAVGCILLNQGSLMLVRFDDDGWSTTTAAGKVLDAVMSTDAKTVYYVTTAGEVLARSLDSFLVDQAPFVVFSTDTQWTEASIEESEQTVVVRAWPNSDEFRIVSFNASSGLCRSRSIEAVPARQFGHFATCGGRFLVWSRNARYVQVLDLDSGALRTIEVMGKAFYGVMPPTIDQLRPGADGRTFLCVSDDNVVRCCDILEGRVTSIWSAPQGRSITECAAGASSGAVMSDSEGWIHIHEGVIGTAIRSRRIHHAAIVGFRINSRTDRGLSWAEDRSVKLWRLSDLHEIASWVAPARFRVAESECLADKLRAVFIDEVGGLGIVRERVVP